MNNCHVNAVCTDTDEGYTCECLPGYFGDGETCVGKIWHGDQNIAILAATETHDDSAPYNMFDGDLHTDWRSNHGQEIVPTLTITFGQVVSFQGVVITPADSYEQRYRNICVYLDKTRLHAGAEEACTDETYAPFEHKQKFTIPASHQKRTNEIYITFPNHYHASITELEIIYSGKYIFIIRPKHHQF